MIEPFAVNGVDAEEIDLGDYPMPIYDGDLEDRDGPPPTARELAARIESFAGLVFLSPEHNGGPSALLKNTIDWLTRVDRGIFRPLLVGLAGASTNSRGATVGLDAMRRLAVFMRLDLVPTAVSIPHASAAFEIDDEGAISLTRAEDIANVDRFVADYARLLNARADGASA